MVKINRSLNARRNIIAGIINKVSIILLPFVVRTVFVYTLGAEYLGLNSLFTAILQVLNLSELGVGTAIIYSMYQPIAANDTDKICALLNFYKKSYKVIGIVILAVGLLIMPFLPNLINGSYPDDINIYVVYIAFLVNTSVSYLLFAYKNSLLNAFQRNDMVSNINTITTVLLNCIQCVLLLLVANHKIYYAYIFMIPLFTVINNIIVAIIVDRKYPMYKCRGSIDRSDLESIKTQVAGLLVNKICQMSRNSLDSIFVSALLGLTMTTIYTNYYYIMNSVTVLMGVLTTSMVAGIGNSIVVETIEKNYDDMEKINFLYMWLSGWCSICLLCLYQPFMKLWMGEEMMLPFSVVILFVVYFYSLKMGDIRGLYSDAAGLWWQNRWRALGEAIANVVLNLVLGTLLGIHGIILGTLISLLIINFGFGSRIIYKYYFKGKKIMEYFMSHAQYALVTTVIAVITYKMCTMISIDGFIKLMVDAIICVFVPNILYLVVYIKTSKFKDSFAWLIKRIKK